MTGPAPARPTSGAAGAPAAPARPLRARPGTFWIHPLCQVSNAQRLHRPQHFARVHVHRHHRVGGLGRARESVAGRDVQRAPLEVERRRRPDAARRPAPACPCLASSCRRLSGRLGIVYVFQNLAAGGRVESGHVSRGTCSRCSRPVPTPAPRATQPERTTRPSNSTGVPVIRASGCGSVSVFQISSPRAGGERVRVAVNVAEEDGETRIGPAELDRC